MKKKLLVGGFIILVFTVYKISQPKALVQSVNTLVEGHLKTPLVIKKTKKTIEEKAEFSQARLEHEFKMQVNPNTGEISKKTKALELNNAKTAKLSNGNSNSRVPDANFVNRGASNLGGRTRAVVVDISDNTGNTIIAGGVSSGVFRTTNGGASWTKVSSNDEIHNVTAIAQDPTNTNIWYYGTGERLGNSAHLSGSLYRGQGIWRSTNGGVSWSQLPTTNSVYEIFDSPFDYNFKLQVHPNTGDLFVATSASLLRYNGTDWFSEITSSSGTSADVVITTTGHVYAGFSGNADSDKEGVWSAETGIGGWTRINETDFTPSGRVVLAVAPSNEDLVYVLFVNGKTADCNTDIQEADLWRWNQDTATFTDFSEMLPSEGCGTSDPGNNPLHVQGGYDLVVSVKPDDANFVVIGGTNAYKKTDITNASSRFNRIGGYNNNNSYAIYNTAGGDEHHPDIHAMSFDPFNPKTLLTGTDGGIHKTDITTGTTDWTSLNNNYQTQQYYHIAIDPQTGSDLVLGGLQDNGTNIGGTVAGFSDLTTQSRIVGGDGVAVAISRDDDCIPLYAGFQNGDIYRNCGGYVFIRPSGSNSQFVTYFHLDSDNNNALYYAGQNRLYRTTDATNVTPDDWDNMSTTSLIPGGSASEWFSRFSTSRGTYNAASSYMLMGTDEGHIYRLDDPQNASSVAVSKNITPPTATTTFPSIVTGLAIHPTNPDIVLATYSNYGIENIFLTTDATSAAPTWTLVERNLSAHSIRSAAITEVAGQTLYFVGTARGLYSTTDPTSEDWEREAPVEIGLALVSDLKYRPSDNKLLIGTHGNGMYEATISDLLSVNSASDISKDIAIYPNPVGSNLNVKLGNTSGNNIKYSITNMLGQSVTNGALKQNSINVENLNTGMYFIELHVDGKKGVKRFIKQ